MRRPSWKVFALICLVAFTAPAGAVEIYLFDGGDSTQNVAIETLLEGAGHTVSLGVTYHAFDGSEDMSAYDVAILLCSANWNSGDMPESGQEALVNFVMAGGGLVSAEWVLWNWDRGYFQVLYQVLPGSSDGGFNYVTPITYTAVRPDSILNRGVNSPFVFSVTSYSGREENVWAKQRASTYYDSDNLTSGLVGWKAGAGWALHFSTPLGPSEMSNPDFSQLFVNAVEWLGGGSCPTCHLPLLLLDP